MEECRSRLMKHTYDACSMLLLVVSPSNCSTIGLSFQDHKMATPTASWSQAIRESLVSEKQNFLINIQVICGYIYFCLFPE